MDNYRRTSHTKFDIKLPFVWITNFRKPLLVGTIATRLRDLVRQICTELEVDILKSRVRTPQKGKRSRREYIEKQEIPKPDDNFKVGNEN